VSTDGAIGGVEPAGVDHLAHTCALRAVAVHAAPGHEPGHNRTLVELRRRHNPVLDGAEPLNLDPHDVTGREV
jgi:hypothetical protein